VLCRHAFVYLSFYLSGKSGYPVVRSSHSLNRFFNSQVRLLSPCTREKGNALWAMAALGRYVLGQWPTLAYRWRCTFIVGATPQGSIGNDMFLWAPRQGANGNDRFLCGFHQCGG